MDRVDYSKDFSWLSNENRIKNIIEAINGDDPTIGEGLIVVGNTLKVNVTELTTIGNRLPLSSNGLAIDMDKVETLLSRI